MSGRMVWLAAALLLAAMPAGWTQERRGGETGFLNRSVKVGETEHPYVVYVPRTYAPDQKLPVILFLHGAGERGTDGLKQSQVGVGGAIRMYQERYPAIVVMPQCLPNQWWTTDAMKAQALAALDASIKEFRCDESRQYLTGLSMGGFGSFALGADHPQRFAAIVPICGGGDPAAMGSKLKEIPMWIYHGGADPVVPPQRSRDMLAAIQQAGGTKVKYSELPGVEHNSWDAAYSDRAMTDWLFQQHR
jgi:predicted peptidase